jgi:hypothetical protein
MRDASCARWWTIPLARFLERHEVRALRALKGFQGMPQLHKGRPGGWPKMAVRRGQPFDGGLMFRRFLPGAAQSFPGAGWARKSPGPCRRAEGRAA